MTQSLVPQVQQITEAQVKELASSEAGAGTAVSFEEAIKHPSFQVANTLHSTVMNMWKLSKAIQDAQLPLPFCMFSPADEDHSDWNMSWGFDDPENNCSTRSCLYTFKADGSVKCREYPADVIQLNTMIDAMNIACVIISDLVQSHEWDKQDAATRLEKLILKNAGKA